MLVDAVEEYGIFMLGPTGEVATWNAGAERIKGYTASEIVGRHFSAFYTADAVAGGKPGRDLEEAAANGQSRDEGLRVRKDGTTFWANVVITAMFGDDRRLVGFAKVTRDDTERKHAEEQVRLLELLTDRERIAGDLSDGIIRRIFEAGLALDAAIRLIDDPEPKGRILRAAETLDTIVKDIRTVVLDLTAHSSRADQATVDAASRC